MQRQAITILGSTGSIGQSTLAVIANHPERFEVAALVARDQHEILAEQCVRFRPAVAVLEDPAAAQQLAERLRRAAVTTTVLAGMEAITQVAATSGDTVMAAIVGAAGLAPTLAAAQAGKKILLANKEALVMSGQLLIQAVQQHGGELLPIDSEHNAIFQCLPSAAVGQRRRGVVKLWLTASGGPFLRASEAELSRVTPEAAVRHPKWQMGAKISVDSATLMNKGLEWIEAVLLFGMAVTDVAVVIHPQSVVHSLVEYQDGSTLAQLAHPDMRVPIAHALAWPERIDSGVKGLDIAALGQLDFEPPDRRRFPTLGLCEAAARAGHSAPAVLNAANELAVSAFLQRQLNFSHIPTVIDTVLSELPVEPIDSLEAVLGVDAKARRVTQRILEKYSL
jgi:1-deoxy-D-xylulose-5-phosphate reductoisomerase